MAKCILGGVSMLALSLSLTIFNGTNREPVKPAIVTEITEDSLYETHVNNLYNQINLEQTGLSHAVFEKALTGYYNLKKTGQVSEEKSILSIADFDKNSTEKRLWIIDLEKKKLVLNTWVAHGQRSGADKATRFSNANESFQSSIGFYLTAEVYRGQHGRSLRLDGMDEGFNSNARSRSIVVHGADYVSQGTINALGRLGRSQGCPAVPKELSNSVIDAIEGKTVLFINVTDQRYTSRYLDEHNAASFASNFDQQDTTSSPDSTLNI